MAAFWATFGYIGLLYILSSGHTGPNTTIETPTHTWTLFNCSSIRCKNNCRRLWPLFLFPCPRENKQRVSALRIWFHFERAFGKQVSSTASSSSTSTSTSFASLFAMSIIIFGIVCCCENEKASWELGANFGSSVVKWIMLQFTWAED